jgi:hypothetical protein
MVFLCQIDAVPGARTSPGTAPRLCVVRALDLHHCSELARLAFGMAPDDSRSMRFMPITDLGPHGLVWSQ